MKSGEIIKYMGGEKASVFNQNWQLISTFDVKAADFQIGDGQHSLNFDCQFNNSGEEPLVKVEIRTVGLKEEVDL